MSNNLKKYSFSDLLKLGKLRIPKIRGCNLNCVKACS